MSFILRYGKMGVKSCPIIAEEAGLEVFTSGDILPKDAAYMFRWGSTASVGGDVKVVNKIKAISKTADKAGFRKIIADAGLAPKTWLDYRAFKEEVKFPVLVRPAEHQRSQGMYVCNDPWEVMEAIQQVGNEYYISEFIQKTKEFRVFVSSGRVAWVIEKTPKDKNAASWGCVEDGDFEYIGWGDWPIGLVDNALKSFALSDLDFGAIDIIMDANGFYTLEINTAPAVTPYYSKTIGKTFKWIVENGRDHFPLREIKDWKDAIHPAVSNQARV
jgi:glutathione synthase/RimK-type ligase-like ATP-grasp enzyme